MIIKDDTTASYITKTIILANNLIKRTQNEDEHGDIYELTEVIMKWLSGGSEKHVELDMRNMIK